MEPEDNKETAAPAEDTVRHTIRIEPDGETVPAGIMVVPDPRGFLRGYNEGYQAGILAVVLAVAGVCLIRALIHRAG